MLEVWRLCRRRHAAFDGEGARRAGGRWNHRGTPLVYTSATLSLAALEYFVHLQAEDAPNDLVAIPARIPEELKMTSVRISDLPSHWRTYPAPEALADLGTRWAQAGGTAVLAVPSAVVPQETNYLLNPFHPGFRKVRVGKEEPFRFDWRMWKPRAGPRTSP